MEKFFKKSSAFTMMELLIVVVLITLFLGITVPFGMDFYRKQVLEENVAEMTNTLKIAQSNAQTGKENSSWGVRFFEEEYVLFMGNSYDEVGRDTSRDKVFSLSPGVNASGMKEVIFRLGTGHAQITPE